MPNQPRFNCASRGELQDALIALRFECLSLRQADSARVRVNYTFSS